MPYLTWLADACRDTGYPVVEVPGWRTRGHGPMKAAHGVVGHWTAGPTKSPKTGNTPSLQVVEAGRPGLDGPLCNVYTAFDGTLYVIAAGKAYHAGVSAWHGETDLNETFVGNEVESPGAFIYTAAQRDVTPRLHAALLNRMGNDESWSCAHYECALPLGRKPDGPARNMPAFRKTVGAYLANPSTIRKPEDDMALSDEDKAWLRALTGAGGGTTPVSVTQQAYNLLHADLSDVKSELAEIKALLPQSPAQPAPPAEPPAAG